MHTLRVSACGIDFQILVAAAAAAPSACTAASELPALFGDRPVSVRLQAGEGRHEVDLGEFGAFAIEHARADRVEVRRWPADPALRDEFLYGPVLLSALAMNGVYALHASAFRAGPGDAPAIAVLADSGTGKSTLAQVARRLGWERLADDILPIRMPDSGPPQILPHYPQLKVASADQYPQTRPRQLPLAMLVEMQRGESMTLLPMNARALMEIVLSATVASRLFPPQWMRAHFAFASALAAARDRGQLSAYRLCLEHAPSEVERIAEQALATLRDNLGAAATPGNRSLNESP